MHAERNGPRLTVYLDERLMEELVQMVEAVGLEHMNEWDCIAVRLALEEARRRGARRL